MSRAVDLYSYDKKKLVDKIMSVDARINDKDLLNRVLELFGDTIGDRYIILNNEFFEDGNCYCNVSSAIARVFKIEDGFQIFDEAFCVSDRRSVDKQEMTAYCELYDAFLELGIEDE